MTYENLTYLFLITLLSVIEFWLSYILHVADCNMSNLFPNIIFGLGENTPDIDPEEALNLPHFFRNKVTNQHLSDFSFNLSVVNGLCIFVIMILMKASPNSVGIVSKIILIIGAIIFTLILSLAVARENNLLTRGAPWRTAALLKEGHDAYGNSRWYESVLPRREKGDYISKLWRVYLPAISNAFPYISSEAVEKIVCSEMLENDDFKRDAQNRKSLKPYIEKATQQIDEKVNGSIGLGSYKCDLGSFLAGLLTFIISGAIFAFIASAVFALYTNPIMLWGLFILVIITVWPTICKIGDYCFGYDFDVTEMLFSPIAIIINLIFVLIGLYLSGLITL